MPIHDLQGYRYRGARALVLLHEKEMRALLPVWKRAKAAALRLPATGDPDYASLESLLHHALRAARGYMTWLCEKLGLPDPGIEPPPEAPVSIGRPSSTLSTCSPAGGCRSRRWRRRASGQRTRRDGART